MYRRVRAIGIIAALVMMPLSVSGAELRKVKAAQNVNLGVMQAIDRLLQTGLGESLPTYPDSLIIQPILGANRYVAGTKRVFFGMFAGSSYIRLTLQITYEGKAIEQDFYDASGAFKGSVTFGHADGAMLEDVCNQAVAYVKQRPWESIGTSPRVSELPPSAEVLRVDEAVAGSGGAAQEAPVATKQECQAIRDQIFYAPNDTSMTAEKTAELRAHWRELGCDRSSGPRSASQSANAEGAVSDPARKPSPSTAESGTHMTFDDCFRKCRELTKRSAEECFDACKQ